MLGLAHGFPVIAVAVLASLIRPDLVSPLAPLLGPWAGSLYGHSDCTMGSVLPVSSGLLVGLGLLLVALGRLGPGEGLEEPPAGG